MTAEECIAELREVLDRDVKVQQWAGGDIRHCNAPGTTLAHVDRIVEKFRIYGSRK